MERSYHTLEPTVLSVNISSGGIPKLPQEQLYVFKNGLDGDGHDHEKHYRLSQAVSLQDIEKLQELNEEGYTLEAGSTGENLTLQGLHVGKLPIGSILEFPSGLQIELTKVRKPCYVLDQIDPQLKEDILDRCGMYAQVNREGIIRPGDSIRVIIPDVH